MTSEHLQIILDGKPVSLAISPTTSLLRALRDAGHTAIQGACEQGECGSCTVVVDGRMQNACLTPASICDSSNVSTVSSLLRDDLATAFSAHGAVQCGFCTPGFVVAAEEALASNCPLVSDEVRERLAGNICRCTGYLGIIDAILHVDRQRRTPIVATNFGGSEPTASINEFGIGVNATRPDVDAKISGAFEYSNDVSLPGMLFGATKRCPHAYARLVTIDTTRTLTHPGIVRVFTADDVPTSNLLGHIVSDQPVFVKDYARCEGEAVAFVVAISQELAWAALDLIDVSWEPMDPVTTIDDSIATSTTPIHPMGNVIRELHIERGNDFNADVVVEASWETGRQDQLFLAPESAVAYPSTDGGVILICATQDLHTDQNQLCSVLGLPPEKIHLINSGIGGAFGGREDITLQAHLTIAALAMNRPVKTTYRRSESFLAHPKRHPSRLTYRLGATSDGLLQFVDATVELDGGPYASTSQPVLGSACYFAAGPYRINSVRIHGRVVRTNNPISGAMRGFGAVQACFGIESTLDLLATRLGIDPIELRRRNVLADGDPFPTSGQILRNQTPLKELIDTCVALPYASIDNPHHVLQSPGGTGLTLMEGQVRQGEGFALGVKNHLYGEGVREHSWASLSLNVHGITVSSSAPECGQGILSVLRQVVNDSFPGVPVSLEDPNTSMQYSGSSSASRQSWMSGSAVAGACRAMLNRLAERLDVESVTIHDGLIVTKSRTYRINEVVGHEKITVDFEYDAPPTQQGDPDNGTGDVHVSWMFVAHKALVSMDTELGLCTVLGIATAQDVGRAINPREVRGQILGGIAQGLGLSLNESLETVAGLSVNNSLTDYLVPTSADMPPVAIAMLEYPDPRSPLGIKGAGEPSSLSITAAIAAAVRKATGRTISRVPIRPWDSTN
jgi:CO/xanthine dehydrogenase Mo-binding subunit/aerobic-type carbon monoxide dehydrogenase small subunit (CoxS/CutS family)